MSVTFLVDFLHLEESETAYKYAVWYEGAGQTLSLIIPSIVALVFVVLFYYVWSKVKATTTFHWCVMGLLSMIASFFVSLFVARASLVEWIVIELGEESDEISTMVATWPYTTDLWIYAVNSMLWCLLFYFVFSVILKRWSPVYNIPFGRKFKKANI